MSIMRGRCFLFLFSSLVLLSCTPSATTPPRPAALYLYRFDPPAFVELAADFQPTGEIPFSIPSHCELQNVFPAPVGSFLAVELGCPNGQTILFLDTSRSGDAAVTQPVIDSDSHFLAWSPEGRAAYLKIDSLGSPRVVRAALRGEQTVLPISEFTYDLASSPNDGEFTFTFSRGMGQGSELWLATRQGKTVELLYADPLHYISLARFSPDGEQIAFIKIPDTSTPFTVGELWVMDADGSKPRKLADADAGHGYAGNWSPDGTRIAFVTRENPADERASQASGALISNIYVIDVQSGILTQITHLKSGRAETPFWSPQGNTLSFNVVVDDRMQVHIAEIATGEVLPSITEPSCCPAWLRK
jgi:dipeptidyl aminopeptidase/acylaminoacyl peptidase